MGSRFKWAPTAFKMLDGIFCIFKPSGLPVHKFVRKIQANLASDLNALPCYQYEIPLPKHGSIDENETERAVSTDTTQRAVQDWSEHRLVLGPRYEEADFDIRFVDGMSKDSSGVLVMGIGYHGHRACHLIAHAKYLRVYHIKGRFGWSTDDFKATGKILEKASYRHVSLPKLTKVCAMAQASYTKLMHSMSGLDPESKEAYEMASMSGIIRPIERFTSPLLYGIRCIDFQPPNFTLEVHSINEDCATLSRLVHDMAIRLKSAAVCSGIRRLRYGHFDLQRALVMQQWHLADILDNLESNDDLLTPDKLLVTATAEEVELLPPGRRHKALSAEQSTALLGDKTNQTKSNTDQENCLTNDR